MTEPFNHALKKLQIGTGEVSWILVDNCRVGIIRLLHMQNFPKN